MRSWATTHEYAARPGAPKTRLPYPTIAGLLAMVSAAWLFVSPFVLGYGQPSRLNDMLVGAAAMLVGLMAVLRMVRGSWSSAALGLLGAWLIVSPLALPQTDGTAGNEIVVGVLLIALALVASVNPRTPRRRG